MSTAPGGFQALTRQTTAQLAGFRSGAAEASKAFGQLGQAAMAEGVLDKTTKELIALALGVGARCDPCIGYHTQALVKLGASRQALIETLAVAVYMGGGPSLMYAAQAISAFDEFSAAAASG